MSVIALIYLTYIKIIVLTEEILVRIYTIIDLARNQSTSQIIKTSKPSKKNAKV